VARCVARETLEKALYFIEQATTAEADSKASRIAYAANLEAAIIYGHAIWDHLSSEFARPPKFRLWTRKRRAGLETNALYRFMSEEGDRNKPRDQIGMRNLFVHRGGSRFRLSASAGTSSVSVRTKVIRAQPWYRRPWRTLYADLANPLYEYFIQRQKTVESRQSGATSPP
jgi:hypothetical protein